MIVLDTNILSELCREVPDRAVLRWYALQFPRELYITSVTRGELVYGALIKAPGRKRDILAAQVDGLIGVEFEHKQLAFDEHAADSFAELKARCKRVGRPSSTTDTMIAAIAKVHGYAVATRNVRDFETFGLELINPFDARGDLCPQDADRIYAALQRNYGRSVKDVATGATYQYRTN